MKLVSLTVENFRSISAARKIPISELTTLIGPNNEGKSNILRALAIGMNTLTYRRIATARRFLNPPITRRSIRRTRDLHMFNWESDYPLLLQNTNSQKRSTITLEFELEDSEIIEFKDKIGSNLNGTLPISFQFGKADADVFIAKQGRGQKVLNQKSHRITAFVADRVQFQYIPAVRTAAAAQRIVEELVHAELSKLEHDPRYSQALSEIADLQQPVLDVLASSMSTTMKRFLPQIRDVRLAADPLDRSMALSSSPGLLIDDGAETLLKYKGDGVQSLAAIAIMRHASEATDEAKDTIIALEEPESHLHPSAIREVRGVLQDLAARHQVVVSTHNPLFTSRINVPNNIIVHGNKAYPARSVKEVRDVLGVRLADNLSSAEVILLVEGDEDRVALTSVLSTYSPELGQELNSGRLSVDVLEGAGNLAHRARLHMDALCQVHAFLDDDKIGREMYKRAESEKILSAKDVNFARCGGKTESELEDLYSEQVYDDILLNECGKTLALRGRDKRKKWAERVRNLLGRTGKPYDGATMRAIKMRVSKAAGGLGWSAIHPSKRGPLESLANSLLSKLSTDP